MKMEYCQETMSDINDMVAEIRFNAVELLQRDNVQAVRDIIEMTYQIANLIQEGDFIKEATA